MIKIGIIRMLFLRVWLLLISCDVSSEELSESGFVYNGGVLSFLASKANDRSGKFVVAWNPKGGDEGGQLLKPGFKITFLGRGIGCDTSVSSGAITSNADWLFGNADSKTGIPIDREQLNHQWSPTGGGQFCSDDSRKRAGPSFVHINESSVQGGIGIFSSSGGENPEKEFFRPFDIRGQNNRGANQNLQGTFVIFRFDVREPGAIFPFGKSSNPMDGRTVLIESMQNLTAFRVTPSDVFFANSPNQVKQQIAFTFINTDCMANRDPNARCQIKYLLHTAVIRESVTNWNNEKWFDKASLLLDPAQGGLPVMQGPIKAFGINTFSRDNPKLSVWKSLGSETLHNKFEPTLFAAEVTYEQFKSALMLATARMSGASAKKDVGRFFGKTWEEPSSWRLLDVLVAQEVHSNNSDAASWIGGGVKSLSIAGRAQ